MELVISPERLADTFAALVAIDSPSRGERRMADELTGRLEALGLTVTEDDAGEQIGGSSGNLYGFLPGTLDLPPLLLCAHMDTVAPWQGKRAVRETDGTIHSAGDTVLGADDLAAVAVILEVLTALRESGVPHRPIEVLFSASEETYCEGAAVFDFSRVRAREAYVLDYEGPLGAAVVAAPTILGFTAAVTGRASHAGFAPEQGISALLAAARAVTAVPSGRVAPDTTVNFGLVEGGSGTNIVPQTCTVRGEIRSMDHGRALEQAALARSAFERACAEIGASLDFQERCFIQAYRVAEDAPVVRRYFDICRARGYETSVVDTFGGSDNNVLAQHGITGVVLPSAMHRCHSCGEYTSVAELAAVASLTADLVLSRT